MKLSMKQHVAKVATICYYQLRRLRQISQRVGREVTIRLILATVMSSSLSAGTRTEVVL